MDLVNSARDRDVVSDARIGWASDDDDGPMCAPFTGERKLLVDLPNNASPLHFFDMFFERDMWDTLVNSTNIYAEQRIASAGHLQRHSRLNKWVPVVIPEMKVFIALVMSMGLLT